MSRDFAAQVLDAVIGGLRTAAQAGTLVVITGRGNHSHNSKSALKPVVMATLWDLGLRPVADTQNDGLVSVDVQA